MHEVPGYMGAWVLGCLGVTHAPWHPGTRHIDVIIVISIYVIYIYIYIEREREREEVPGYLGAWVPGCLGAWVPGGLSA